MSQLVTAVRDAFEAAAKDARRRFRNGKRNGFIDGSPTVHTVQMQAWFGLDVPGPGCHVGVGTWDFTGFKPTTKGVTCGRCLRSGASSDPTADHPNQTHLDFGVADS